MNSLTPNVHNVHLIIKERFGFELPIRKSPENISFLAKSTLNIRRKTTKIENRFLIRTDKNYDKLCKWITSIQKTYNWNDTQFARQLGLKSRRMVINYRMKEGSIPSRKILVRLLELEKMSRAVIVR